MQDNIVRAYRTFGSAPHRMLFFGGVSAMVLSMLWWTLVLLGRMGLMWLPAPDLPPTWVHAWLMVYGIFPFFILGFLLTAFPRWIGAPPVAARVYQAVALALYSGYLLVLFGASFAAWVAALGMAITVAAWLAGLMSLAFRLKDHRPQTSPHPSWALLLLALGLLGALLAVWGAITGNVQALAAGPRLGVWGFLAPMVFVVAHRMLPFFAQSALPGYKAFRPGWMPATMALLLIGHAGLLLAGMMAWLWLADVPLAVLAGWVFWRWQPWRARPIPLLWSLFAAFFWLPVALALSAVQSISVMLGGSMFLGLAPQHVLAIGVLTSMVVAMATRVSLGHSGRALRMDRVSLACFLVLQVAVVTRLLAELPGLPLGRYTWLIMTAALWLLAITPWAVQWGRRYWQPRIDGQPG